MDIKLFDGIAPKDRKQIMECFGARTESFNEGETILSYGQGNRSVGIVLEGMVNIEKTDANGNRMIMEQVDAGEIFGEMIAFSRLAQDDFAAVTEEACIVVFFDNEKISHPCGKLCGFHLKMIDNMLAIMSQKSMKLSERVVVLSNRSIREKLLHYFSILAAKNGSRTFRLPVTGVSLADYICAARSAVAREMKKMCGDGVIQKDRRNITLL